MLRPALIVHGGAGPLAPELESPSLAGCVAAARDGWAVLERDGFAIDAVTAAVVVLENDPIFNAGLGAVLTSAGTIETDASLMDGRGIRAGACGAVTGVRNPIRLARSILEDGTHVLLVGNGAETFAKTSGLAMCPPEGMITDRQRARWRQRANETGPQGTVGAVAVDARGHVAAATSTGGIFYKSPGRVGDSAVIGAGTYADDRAGAASATGAGEAIIRVVLAKTAADLVRDGRDPMSAARAAIALLTECTGAAAGLILVDPFGRIGYARNTARMPVAFRHALLGEIVSEC